MSDDRSFLYGDALFETVRVEETGPVELGRHIERFSRSAQALGYPTGCLTAGIAALAALSSREPGIYRVTIGRDDPDAPFTGNASVVETRRELPTVPIPRPRLTLLEDWYFPEDRLAEHKTSSYLRRVEQRRRAVEMGYDDALAVSPDGLIGEASAANVFFDFPSGIVTSPVRGILPGTTRARILEKFDVLIRPVKVRDLEYVRGIVLTNAAMLAVAALDLNGRSLSHHLAMDFIEEL